MGSQPLTDDGGKPDDEASRHFLSIHYHIFDLLFESKVVHLPIIHSVRWFRGARLSVFLTPFGSFLTTALRSGVAPSSMVWTMTDAITQSAQFKPSIAMLSLHHFRISVIMAETNGWKNFVEAWNMI
mmetsp:Transcript_36502/g.66027  ORF Transcript_36502/g.66027 Transcript_36502/m.66027 type:complete len:127 (-) Transcript_36502:1788-2168(-)